VAASSSGSSSSSPSPEFELAARVVAELTRRGMTIAIAESLTGGLVVAELVSVPGASAVVRGGVVAYATDLKSSLLGVDAELLARRSPIDPEVVRQMAEGVRARLGHNGRPASIGLATTGVAGPEQQDGHPVGEVWLGLAMDGEVEARGLTLGGDRASIRTATVAESLKFVLERLEHRATE
jgi:nicotinamide-nucleotide amidase